MEVAVFRNELTKSAQSNHKKGERLTHFSDGLMWHSVSPE